MRAACAALALALVTVPTVPRLQALGRQLLSMATSHPSATSGPPSATSDPTSATSDPTSATSDPSSGSYVPGSVSAAFVTCPNETVAKELARALVGQRLAACVNILPHVTSVYEWQGKLEEDSEVLLMIKTRSSRVPELAQFIRSSHPYEVPEVVALPVAQGNPPYLSWVLEGVPPPTGEPPK